jgi:hypothetical protein
MAANSTHPHGNFKDDLPWEAPAHDAMAEVDRRPSRGRKVKNAAAPVKARTASKGSKAKRWGRFKRFDRYNAARRGDGDPFGSGFGKSGKGGKGGGGKRPPSGGRPKFPPSVRVPEPAGVDFESLPDGAQYRYTAAISLGLDEVWEKVEAGRYRRVGSENVYHHPVGCPVLPA